jgi:dethiobiotin synthetase
VPTPGLFITGTDTDCGKTYIATGLVRALRAQGLRVAPYKPVAAGAGLIDGELRNEDALQLIEAAGGGWDYQQVNPYCLPAAVSPHLAARDADVSIELDVILQGAQRLAAQADVLVVEGAGGWLVPLNNDLLIADLAKALQLPVLLVVGLRLGCLNHAALSAQAIQQSDVPVLGWVGSQVDPHMQCVQENIETLQQQLAMPYWGSVGYQSGADEIFAQIVHQFVN